MAQKKIKAKKSPARPKELLPLALVQAMGADYFDPIPPDQHGCWQWIPGTPPLIRMWSVMCACTIGYARRLPYAIDQFRAPLDMKGLAALCGLDLPNAYLYWKQGVALGLWRGRVEEDGDTQGELFLCGKVTAAEDEPDGKEEDPEINLETNCTYIQLPDAVRKRLKDYQLNDLAKLPDRRKLEFINHFNRDVHIELGAHAELTAALRLIMDPRHDRTFDEFGIKKIRETHKRSDLTPEQVEARKKRIKALARRLKLYVETIEAEYTPPEVSYTPQDGSVQGVGARPTFNIEVEVKKKSTSSASTYTPQATTTNSPIDSDRLQDWVREAMEPHVRKPFVVDDDAVRQIIAGCRKKMPDITPGEIVEATRAKGKMSETAKNPVAAFIKNVPKFLDPKAVLRERENSRAAGSKLQDLDSARRSELEAILRNPNVPDDEKDLARIALGQQAAGGGAD